MLNQFMKAFENNGGAQAAEYARKSWQQAQEQGQALANDIVECVHGESARFAELAAAKTPQDFWAISLAHQKARLAFAQQKTASYIAAGVSASERVRSEAGKIASEFGGAAQKGFESMFDLAKSAAAANEDAKSTRARK